MSTKHRYLLAGAATALCLGVAAPAAAQSADAGPPAPEAPAEAPVRLVAMGGREKGIIRPLAGPIGLRSGKYSTFAGDVAGTSTRTLASEDKLAVSGTTIRAQAVELNAFGTTIRAQWSDPAINGTYSYSFTPNTFWGTQYASADAISASGTTIRAVDTNLEGSATRIRALAAGIRSADGLLLSFDSASTNYTGIHREIVGMVAATKGVYGSAVQAQTGQTFENGFSNRMLGKWGVDLADARSIAGMNEVDLELFLLDWRDNAHLFSGLNSVDYWMKAVNWTPATSHQLQSAQVGAKVQVGVLDFALSPTAEARTSAQLRRSLGYTNTGVHGAAVTSLIVGAHDGRGVMGLAPKSDVHVYNPFDTSQTASWADVKKGIISLGNSMAVVNMSLGVPGATLHQGWHDIFADTAVKSALQHTVFVMAAGNDGVTQTTNVRMSAASLQNPFIVVGSVDPDNVISGFSNRPGTTCLEDAGCKSTARWTKGGDYFSSSDYLKDSGLLMNRFIVAPGEFMLVDDGEKGVTRMSGTSFAAPLVSGAVALIVDRWPWLKEKPRDVAHIVLTSARDLGEAGTDPVYGRGMLDVQAAMAPLDWAKVTFKQSVNGGALTDTSLATLKATNAYTRSTWETNSAYFYVYEATTQSYRDFYVPMSSKLVGQTVGTNRDQMNWYLQSRFQAALGTAPRFAGSSSTAYAFGPARFSAPVGGFGSLGATVTMAPRAWRPGLRQGTQPFDTALALGTPDGRVAVRFGGGAGGSDVDGRAGFGLQSDYDVHTGGANPFLGLASGGGYAAADVKLTDRLTVSAGASGQTARRDLDQLALQDRMALGRLGHYRADATLLSANYRAAGWLAASLNYTQLNEGTGVLGVQSLDRSDLRRGSTTDAATLGAELTPGHGLAVSLSGTMGRTRETDLTRQNMGVAAGGLVSSAFQVAVSKVGLFDGRDRLRVTLAQPLHVERGELAVNQVKVVDRSTGELGTAVETFDLDSGPRRFVAEAVYGRSLMNGKAEFGLFGRANLRGEAVDQSAVTVGGSFRLGF